MTIERFNEIIQQQLRKTAELLTVKGNEYAPDVDRLAAF